MNKIESLDMAAFFMRHMSILSILNLDIENYLDSQSNYCLILHEKIKFLKEHNASSSIVATHILECFDAAIVLGSQSPIPTQDFWILNKKYLDSVDENEIAKRDKELTFFNRI